MKPIFMSWKTYAKKLEADMNTITEKTMFIQKYDTLISSVLDFPNLETLINYLRIKAEINSKLSHTFSRISNNVSPTNVNKAELELRQRYYAFKQDLDAYMRQSGIYNEG